MTEIKICKKCGEEFEIIGYGKGQFKPQYCGLCIEKKYKYGKTTSKLNLLGTTQLGSHRNPNFKKEKKIIKKEKKKLGLK